MVRSLSLLLALLLSLSLLSGCRRSRQDIWDDTRSCGRHMMQGIRSLGGYRYDSREIRSRDEFMPADRNGGGVRYAPLPEGVPPDELAMIEYGAPRGPYNRGSPQMQEGVREMPCREREVSRRGFETIRFPYNSDLIKGSGQLTTLRNVSAYLRSHPDATVMVEGHCDERGAEAYNMALGLRRAHSVRNALMREGVDARQLQVISYGKERPIDIGHHEEAWSKNRRAEFRVYER